MTRLPCMLLATLVLTDGALGTKSDVKGPNASSYMQESAGDKGGTPRKSSYCMDGGHKAIIENSVSESREGYVKGVQKMLAENACQYEY